MPQQKNQLPVIIFNDFVCPYSYIAQDQMDRLEKDYGIEINWRPHWLTRDVPPEGRPMGDNVDHARRAAQMEWLKEMAPEKADKIRQPNFTPYTFRAFEAMEYARENGKASPFRTAAFDAMWLDGKDVGKLDVLQEVAAKVGLSPDGLGRALNEGRYTEKTLRGVNTARDIGITMTPTIIIGKSRIEGWVYYEVLQQVMEQNGAVPLAVGG